MSDGLSAGEWAGIGTGVATTFAGAVVTYRKFFPSKSKVTVDANTERIDVLTQLVEAQKSRVETQSDEIGELRETIDGLEHTIQEYSSTISRQEAMLSIMTEALESERERHSDLKDQNIEQSRIFQDALDAMLQGKGFARPGTKPHQGRRSDGTT